MPVTYGASPPVAKGGLPPTPIGYGDRSVTVLKHPRMLLELAVPLPVVAPQASDAFAFRLGVMVWPAQPLHVGDGVSPAGRQVDHVILVQADTGDAALGAAARRLPAPVL